MKRVLWAMFVFAAVFAFASSAFAEDAIQLRWRLPQGAKYTYEYSEQTTITKITTPKTPDGGDVSVQADGPIVLLCKGDEADTTTELKVKMSVKGKDTAKERKELPVSTTKQLMDATGKIFSSSNSASGNIQIAYDLIFPMPQQSFDANKANSRDVQVYVNGAANFNGKAEYAYKGTKVVKGVNCIAYHLSCKLEAAEREVGEALKFAVSGNIVADYDCLFAVEEGYLVSADGGATISYSMKKTKGPDVDDLGRATYKKVSVTQKMKDSLHLKSVDH